MFIVSLDKGQCDATSAARAQGVEMSRTQLGLRDPIFLHAESNYRNFSIFIGRNQTRNTICQGGEVLTRRNRMQRIFVVPQEWGEKELILGRFFYFVRTWEAIQKVWRNPIRPSGNPRHNAATDKDEACCEYTPPAIPSAGPPPKKPSPTSLRRITVPDIRLLHLAQHVESSNFIDPTRRANST